MYIRTFPDGTGIHISIILFYDLLDSVILELI